ncbi:MAG: RDD family protein [Candidatus Thorarchaeota archaeon]
MIDPNAFLFAIAIVFGGIALVIVFLIYISQRAKLRRRIVAMVVDIAFLRLVLDLVLGIFNPDYISLFIIAGTRFSLDPLVGLLYLVLSIGASVLSYLFFYIPFFGGFDFPNTALLVAIFGFLYFFVCDAFFEGKTMGRRILKLKTHHESKDRTFSFGEASINAIGKTFLILDLILGYLVSVFDSRNPELRQVRLTQKLARVVTIDPSVSIPSDGNNSQSFMRDNDESGVLW